MAKLNYVFTSESVSEGHPDKVCDRISDAIVDLYLSHDPQARVAVETLATTNQVVLAGEVRGPDSIKADQLVEVARAAVKDIGYEQDGFHWEKMDVKCFVHSQSADIAVGVDAAGNKDEGAGDQGIMFGYACRETPALMPAPIYYSHAILKSLAEARHSGAAPQLGPDAKSQVTLQYVDGRPTRATAIVLSTQHAEGLDQDAVREIVLPHIVNCLPEGWMCDPKHLYVNPTGRFVIGGPDGDAGLTGRKIIVDTYGGAAPHGGGAFSGKIRRRSTARPPTPPATSPRTSSRRNWRRSARSRSPTPSACRSRCRSMSTPTAPALSTRIACPTCCSSWWTCPRAASARIWA